MVKENLGLAPTWDVWNILIFVTPLKSWDKPTIPTNLPTIVLDDILPSCFVTSPGVFAQDCPPTKCSTTSTTTSIPHFSAQFWWCWFVWHLKPMWYSTSRMQVEALEMDAPRCGEFFGAICFMWRTYLGKMYETKESGVKIHLKWTVLIFSSPKLQLGKLCELTTHRFEVEGMVRQLLL